MQSRCSPESAASTSASSPCAAQCCIVKLIPDAKEFCRLECRVATSLKRPSTPTSPLSPRKRCRSTSETPPSTCCSADFLVISRPLSSPSHCTTVLHPTLLILKRACVSGQDLSTAGRRLGMDGKRSVLFWHVIRIAEELPKKPEWIFLENVPGIRQLALRQVATALSDAGYDVRWTTLRVSAIGGHHRRERWFGLARLRPPAPVADPPGASGEPDALPELQQPADGNIQPRVQELARGPAYQTGFWLCEPGVDRMADGVSPRMDRCRLRRNHMLGNAVCPPQALFAFRILAGLGPYPAKSAPPKRGMLSRSHQPIEEPFVDE